MSERRASLPDAYFEALYRADQDPWRFVESAYEAEKYDHTLAILRPRRFARALEIGCSIGVLTRRLADLCDRLVATDVAETALRQARERCSGLSSIEIRQMRAPGQWPSGTFDLVLISEVLYYLDAPDVVDTARRAAACLRDEGMILLVHWTGQTDYPLTGDEASELFVHADCAFPFAPLLQTRGRFYRLDLLKKGERASG